MNEDGSVIEWMAFTPPAPLTGLSAIKGRTVVTTADPVEPDGSPFRFLLLGWNYGPKTVVLFLSRTGDQIGNPVPPQSEFVIPGTNLGGVTEQLAG